MPSQYLQPNEVVEYGLPGSTTVPQVVQASLLIDAYLNRPEGLVYGVDYLGQPAYMLGDAPQPAGIPRGTLKSVNAISPGKAVQVTLSPSVSLTSDSIGSVVILDKATAGVCEACAIQAIAPGGVITLFSVANSHNANCTIDFGMTIFEERELPAERSLARVSRPIVRLMSGLGRYGYGRRTTQDAGLYTDVNLLAIIQEFGGPPMWIPFDPLMASVTPSARELWVPAGELLAYYSSVRLYYVSGYAQAELPAMIKMATATLVSAISASAVFQGQLKEVKTGTTQFSRFAPSVIDQDTRRMIDNFRCFQFI